MTLEELEILARKVKNLVGNDAEVVVQMLDEETGAVREYPVVNWAVQPGEVMLAI